MSTSFSAAAQNESEKQVGHISLIAPTGPAQSSLKKESTIKISGKDAKIEVELQLPEVSIPVLMDVEKANGIMPGIDKEIHVFNGYVCAQLLVNGAANFELKKEKWSAKMTVDGKDQKTITELRLDGVVDFKSKKLSFTENFRGRVCSKKKHLKTKQVSIELFDTSKQSLGKFDWQGPWPAKPY